MQTMRLMPSPARGELSGEITARAALLLLAVGINALEYLLPRVPVFPWLKPGLANIVTMLWIIRWGAVDALVFTIVRSWITSFFFGFSLVSFMLSISGGVAAAAGMGALWMLFGRRGWLGLIGLGIAGAVLHNAGQLYGVYILLAATPVIWYQVPFMLLASLAFGGVTGFFAHALLPLLDKEAPAAAACNEAVSGNDTLRLCAGGALIAVCCGIAVIRSPPALAASAALASLLAYAAGHWKFRVLLVPVRRFWLLFGFVGVMYLFFSYGRTIAGISFVTHEGIHETLLQWLRLWTWIELSIVLTRLEFNRIVLAAAARHVPFGRETFVAALFALELFPAFVGLLRPRAKAAGERNVVAGNIAGRIFSSIERLFRDILRLVGGGGRQGRGC